MSSTNTAFQAFLAAWETLKTARGGEHDFGPHGAPNLSFAVLDQLFERWGQAIGVLQAKGVWESSPEAAIADAPLGAAIAELASQVSSAVPNGVSWLIASQFIQKLHDVQTQLSNLTLRRISLNREVAKELSNRGLSEIEQVVTASAAAKNVLKLSASAKLEAATIAAAAATASETLTSLEVASNRVIDLETTSKTNETSIQETKVRVEGSADSLQTLITTAEAGISGLKQKIASANQQVEETKAFSVSTYESVEKALKAVRAQGLAGAFSSRSKKLSVQRLIWTGVFVAAIAVLAVLSFQFALALNVFTYEVLLVSLVRKLALAAPTVWLGWYAAKQTGRIARVQEDYEYKAASALAYQAYRDEAKVVGDPELQKQLLSTAISTFGDNPVRLYSDSHTDTVSPLEDAFKKMAPDKIAEVFASLAKLKSV